LETYLIALIAINGLLRA